MLKNITRLEHKIGDKVYHLTCDMDCPLKDVKEACFNFLKYLGNVEDAHKAAQAEQEKLKVPSCEEPKVEMLEV